jgi:hypothetical protein
MILEWALLDGGRASTVVFKTYGVVLRLGSCRATAACCGRSATTSPAQAPPAPPAARPSPRRHQRFRRRLRMGARPQRAQRSSTTAR